jgi:uncharacterized membrane protein YccC
LSVSHTAIGESRGHQPWLDTVTSSDVRFAVRTAGAGIAALFAAMWLQLDVPRWAMWTVVIVSPPLRGNALRKTAARVVGTLVGCSVGVMLVALFPQDRVGFYAAFSLWLGTCAYWATLRQGYASYGATLAAFTSAIISTNVSTTPQSVFEIAIARGSATLVGILFAYFASEIAARNDDVPGDLARRVRSLAVILLDWAATQLLGKSDKSKDTTLPAAILGLNEFCINAIAERPSLAWVKRWIVGLPTALLSLESAVLSLRDEVERRQVTSASARIAGEVLKDTADFLRSEAALDLSKLRRQSASVARFAASTAALPHGKRFIDALAYLLAGLEAILSLRPPRSAVPIYPAPEFVADTQYATINSIRTVAGVMLGFLVWNATAWSHGPIFVANVVVTLVLFVRLEDPVTANLSNVFGNLIGGGIALTLKYLILAQHNDPLVLAAVLFPLILIGVWLETKPTRASFAIFAMNGLLILMEPTNPQTYDFVDAVNTLFAITVACAFVSFIFLTIHAHRTGKLRALELLTRMRQSRWAARPGSTRVQQLGWETRMYDEMQRLQAATSNPKVRALGVRLLLSGLRTLHAPGGTG